MIKKSVSEWQNENFEMPFSTLFHSINFDNRISKTLHTLPFALTGMWLSKSTWSTLRLHHLQIDSTKSKWILSAGYNGLNDMNS